MVEVNVTLSRNERVEISKEELICAVVKLIYEGAGVSSSQYLLSGNVVYDRNAGGHNNDIETVFVREATQVDFDTFKTIAFLENYLLD